MKGVFLTAEWRKLIMAQYAVDPALLTPWLPAGVELDLYRARCYVSLVGFLFDRVRIRGVAVPFHTRFGEVNLRFYVARREPGGSRRRGVVFIREFVPKPAIATVARTLYEEPYATAEIQHSIALEGRKLRVQYDWKADGKWQSMSAEAVAEPRPIAANSEEEFITEHYWGYTKRSGGYTSEYEVEHPRWSIYDIERSHIQADFGALYGPAFASLDAAQPASILLAEGSAVRVFGGERLNS